MRIIARVHVAQIENKTHNTARESLAQIGENYEELEKRLSKNRSPTQIAAAALNDEATEAMHTTNSPPVQLLLFSVLIVTHFEPQIPNRVQSTVPQGPS